MAEPRPLSDHEAVQVIAAALRKAADGHPAREADLCLIAETDIERKIDHLYCAAG